jgi:hypothetical protein
VLAALCIYVAELELSFWQWGLLLLLAFDIVGGIAANATPAATRQFHSGPQKYGPLLFATAHIQPFLVAGLLPNFSWSAAAGLYVSAVVCVLVVTESRGDLKRAVSLALCGCAVGAHFLIWHSPGWEWLAPALLIKLVASHSVPAFIASESPANGRSSGFLND